LIYGNYYVDFCIVEMTTRKMAKQTIAGNKGDHYSSIWFPLKYGVRTQFSDLALTDIPIHSYSRVSSSGTGTAIYFEEICQPVQAY